MCYGRALCGTIDADNNLTPPAEQPHKEGQHCPPRRPDCKQSERSHGIKRPVTAGEQNNKWPGVSPKVLFPNIFTISGLQ